MLREMEDGTYRPRDRSLIGKVLGKSYEKISN